MANSSRTTDYVSKLIQSELPDQANPVNKKLDELWQAYNDEISKKQQYLDETIEITPNPAFVCKAVGKYKTTNTKQPRAETSVVINICSSPLIGKPRTAVAPNINEQGLCVRMSCGEELSYFDENEQKWIPAFDVVFHPDTITEALQDNSCREAVCVLAANRISEKSVQLIVGQPFQFPKCVYKGVSALPPPQRIRRDKAESLIQCAHITDDTFPTGSKISFMWSFSISYIAIDQFKGNDTQCLVSASEKNQNVQKLHDAIVTLKNSGHTIQAITLSFDFSQTSDLTTPRAKDIVVECNVCQIQIKHQSYTLWNVNLEGVSYSDINIQNTSANFRNKKNN
ncbi:hypothetical protein RFI_28006 [Reticulomyxa filosa]|uniref:PIH1 N-terminal domain-containing protein n=1 Tax=Reticulomyxa filosa TaxID=46433 RepID=X6M5X9_RETFI|nr:hypothetical protein RFI_28006 [Reticulomyxa filosa]|eukprot:ETO09373.1 hypothetical protein RFI_28006 [Reticulomyxa filosa]